MSALPEAPDPGPLRADLSAPLGEPEELRPLVAHGECCPACGAILGAVEAEGVRALSPVLRRVLAGL